MRCPKCNYELPEGARFCGECGYSLQPNTCPACGAAVQSGTRFCAKCGTPLGGGESQTVERQAGNPKQQNRRRSPGIGNRKIILIVVLCAVAAAAVLAFVFRDSWQTDGAKQSKSSASSVLKRNTKTEFSEYLYMEDVDYTELSGGFTDDVLVENEIYSYHVASKEVEIGEITWTLAYSYLSDVAEAYEYFYTDGAIRGTTFTLEDYTSYTDDEILEYVESYYSDYDYVDTFSDDYTSYQWDGVESGDYNAELILEEDECILYFFAASEDGDGDPTSVVDNVNQSESIDDLLDNFVFSDSKSDLKEYMQELTNCEISLELQDMQRLSSVYATQDLLDTVFLAAAFVGNFYPDSHFYVLYVESTVTADSDTETFDCYAIVGYYRGEWVIYNFNDVTDYMFS